MYEVNLKNDKKNIIMFVIFLIVGLIFLTIMGVFTFFPIIEKNVTDSKVIASDINWNKHKNSDGDITYSPIYTYSVDNKEYVCESFGTINQVNTDVEGYVYYDSSDPEYCVMDYQLKITWIYLTLIIPIVFITLGLVGLIKQIKKINKMKMLGTTGLVIKGLPFNMVSANIKLNNRKIYCISVTYTFPDGTTKKLKGSPRYDRYNPTAYQTAYLIYDPNDYKNYYIDFEK